MPKQNLTPEILAAALVGLEAQRARLDAQIGELKRMMGAGRREPAAATEAPKRRRKLSAAGRKRIVEATRKRWAEYHRKKAEEAKKPARKSAAKGPKKAVAATGGAE
jgi:peptidoglycan hydrolase CwlO-like protein